MGEADIPSPYTMQGEGQPFGYTDYRYDTDSGTYFAQAREYQPQSGRFCAQDVVAGNGAVPKTLNRYGYCLSNPVNFVDYDGRKYIVVWSYGKGEIKEFEKYMNQNYNTQLNEDTSTSDWTEETWSEWNRRSSFSRAAHTKLQELIDSGVPEDEIIIERIDSKTDLEDKWKEWKLQEQVEGMYFYSHGYSEGAEVYNGSGDFWENADKLNFAEDAVAIFYGCNTANGSFAQNFANTQGITTYAQVDYCSFSHNPNLQSRISTHDTSLGVYLHPYKWGLKGIPIEVGFWNMKYTDYRWVFGRWNSTGEGKKFEPCE